MTDNTLSTLETTTLEQLTAIQTLQELESLKVAVLGKKGGLTQILKSVSQLTPEERPKMGQACNRLKHRLLDQFDQTKNKLENAAWESELTQGSCDATLPGHTHHYAGVHPLQQVIDDVIGIFERLGFTTQKGPDIESDYYNFESLNIPSDHPARDMHDTFYLNSGHVMRTHTSPVQIRCMEQQKPPIKIICPGKVYRCDSDVTHSAVFHQCEGLYVNENVTFGELKGTLEYFLKTLFGQDKKVRFRPSYFPFTEPSTEVDVYSEQIGWMEILGAGMVHPNVFKSVGYPDSVSGFAFGLGIERIAMLRYNIPDIRLFYENDWRFLKQF